jgi:hypothetical protein
VKSPDFNSCAPDRLSLLEQMVLSVKYRLMYSARLISLIVTTAAGIFFLISFGIDVWQFHVMPGIVTRQDVLTTLALGSVSLCFGAWYVFLVRKTDRSN